MLIALPSAFGDAATNMAIDAALLSSIPKSIAALRHYGWTEPAVTFGYAQHYNAVKEAVGDQTLCRRLTGGGIVDHRNDWTYALVIGMSLSAASLQATEVYKRVHLSISRALESQGIINHLAPCPRHCDEANIPTNGPTPDQCFIKPAANDVLSASGQKIAGAAMKRTRSGLLLQGSMDRATLPESFDFSLFHENLLAHISETLELERGELEDIRPLFDSSLIKKEKERFTSAAWNAKR